MATDIRTSSLKQPIDVAEYLFSRLKQIGVQSIHGVPGDFNLVALDYVEKLDLKWVGNCNELNAGMKLLKMTLSQAFSLLTLFQVTRPMDMQESKACRPWSLLSGSERLVIMKSFRNGR